MFVIQNQLYIKCLWTKQKKNLEWAEVDCYAITSDMLHAIRSNKFHSTKSRQIQDFLLRGKIFFNMFVAGMNEYKVYTRLFFKFNFSNLFEICAIDSFWRHVSDFIESILWCCFPDKLQWAIRSEHIYTKWIFFILSHRS